MRIGDKMDHKTNTPRSGVDVQTLGLATAKLAHELNNPLDAVMRYISLAQRTLRHGQISETERYLSDAQFGLQRMAEVLRELLETGQLHDPLPVAGTETAELSYVAQQAADTLRPQSQKSQVHVLIEVPDNTQVTVTLYQVLLNLIENAIDVAPTETIVHVSAEVIDHELMVHVSDQGPGISPADLPHIFEPFFTRKSLGQGTGLGLAVCKEIVSRLGGAIWAESTGQGCRMNFKIPFSR